MGEWIHVFLTSTLVGSEWSAPSPGRFSPGKEPPVHIGQGDGWAPQPVWTTRRGE
jgi:hypothetical protein